MTDYKQLCAELIRTYPMAWGPSGKWRNPEQNLALERARAALAAPEPQRRRIYSPVQIAECGGPCQQGPEHCDCGELWVTESEPELEPTLREEFTMILNEARCNSNGRVIGNIELGRRLVKAVEQFMCAQPESEGPTDEEIEEWADACSEAPLEEPDPEVYGWRRCFTAQEFSETIRAAIARWGNHPGSPDRSGNLKAGLTRSPAAGEVAELVAWLRRSTGCADESPMDLRAADLLERLSPPRLAAEPPPPEQGQAFKDADTGVIYVRDGDQWLATQPVPQPVPVSERLPGPGDCDAEGLCWVWNTTAYTWGLFRLDLTVHSHWLPAHALPQPS